MDSTKVESCTEIQSENEEIDIYFIVSEPKEKEEESSKNENIEKIKYTSKLRPKIIYEKEIKIENDSYMKNKVFKLNMKLEIIFIVFCFLLEGIIFFMTLIY